MDLCPPIPCHSALPARLNTGDAPLLPRDLSSGDTPTLDFDDAQEVARSSFGDMLHDSGRHRCYSEAIRLAVNKMHQRGKFAFVLDIGTGTGLLSMMAAKWGADTVVACEAVGKIAECSKKVIRDNKLHDKIHVVAKRSTDLTVGPDGDLKCRANILVTEMFDTELIGECAIEVFSHAHRELLEEDCLVVPSAAVITAQVVQSRYILEWNQFDNVCPLVDTPPEVLCCPGTRALHDLQLSRVSPSRFSQTFAPADVIRFNWSSSTIHLAMQTAVTITAERDGTADVVLVWWRLLMDEEETIVLDCAPEWCGHRHAPYQWRDHWLQSIYYLPSRPRVKEGDVVRLVSCHDSHSLWFAIEKDSFGTVVRRPECECLVHDVLPRTRLKAMNCSQRQQLFLDALIRVVDSDTVALALGDACLLGLAVARMGARQVYCAENVKRSRRAMEKFIAHNGLSKSVAVLEYRGSLIHANRAPETRANLIFAEPYFHSALLPWHNMQFWQLAINSINLVAPGAVVMPFGASLLAMAVEFDHLWKVKAPAGEVEGFNLRQFDSLMEEYSGAVDDWIEPYPLWEYATKSRSDSTKLLEFSFSNLGQLPPSEATGRIDLTREGTCHAIVFWVDWHLDAARRHTVSTGVTDVKDDLSVEWTTHSQQGVYFLKEMAGGHIDYQVHFEHQHSELKFNIFYESCS